MKNKNLNLSDVAAPLASFFKRFHTILFFLLVSGGLFIAIFSLLSIIELSSGKAGTPDQAVNGSFDQTTIDKVKMGGTSTITPSGRQSPFTE